LNVAPRPAAASGAGTRGDGRGGTYDAGVVLGPDPRVLGPEGIDDAPETEVDAGGEEGGPDGQGADLGQEGVLAPLVLVGEDAGGVADDLAQQAEGHGDEEAETAARGGVDGHEADEGKAEEGCEDGIGHQVDSVEVERRDFGALGQVGVLVTDTSPVDSRAVAGNVGGHDGRVLEGEDDGRLTSSEY